MLVNHNNCCPSCLRELQLDKLYKIGQGVYDFGNKFTTRCTFCNLEVTVNVTLIPKFECVIDIPWEQSLQGPHYKPAKEEQCKTQPTP